MEARAVAIRNDRAPELVWLLQHSPLYTGGTSAKSSDLKTADQFPVFSSSRGGQYTYHGPGQRVAYVMLDLEKRGKDVRCFVRGLERWIIETLATFELKGEIKEGRVGVWINRTSDEQSLREDKIAAIGVRIRKWVTFHGIAINVHPNLDHFSGIVPCGIDDAGLGVTSFADLGQSTTMSETDAALEVAFNNIFGPTRSPETR